MSVTSISVAKPGTPPGAAMGWVGISPAFVGVSIRPDISGFERAFRDMAAMTRNLNRAMADIGAAARRAHRQYARMNRRPALIHNGRKPR